MYRVCKEWDERKWTKVTDVGLIEIYEKKRSPNDLGTEQEDDNDGVFAILP